MQIYTKLIYFYIIHSSWYICLAIDLNSRQQMVRMIYQDGLKVIPNRNYLIIMWPKMVTVPSNQQSKKHKDSLLRRRRGSKELQCE